ncbi:MAG: hypothetical protein AVDCRST_MAG14-2213, partial [uncultured Rubrobacteraceae bacterium]
GRASRRGSSAPLDVRCAGPHRAGGLAGRELRRADGRDPGRLATRPECREVRREEGGRRSWCLVLVGWTFGYRRAVSAFSGEYGPL